jgi:outer membrane protein TolC
MKSLLPMILALTAAAGAAVAAEAPDLPPKAQVERALRNYPLVLAAQAGVRFEEANRDRLDAGPHEFALRLTGQRRRERPLDLDTREHELAIERAVRLPGKAARDAELGAAGVEQAHHAMGDALHESGRLLLERWFDWLRGVVAAREWAAQVEVLHGQHQAVAKRVAAGDAARLESLVSSAQLAQAEAQLAEAAARRDRAGGEFAQHFPGIALDNAIAPAQPVDLAEAAPNWRDRIVAENHELQVATLASRRAQIAARRADAERRPDPTLGLKVGSERGGQERIVGLQLTIPLAGAGRAAAARAGEAEADAAVAREALVRLRVEAEALRTVSLAQGSYGQWLRLAEVSSRMAENVRLLDRAWRLGEGQFAELQTARRQAIEARLAAAQAQLDANQARYRLLLDAHRLWPLDGEGHD